MYCTHSDRTTVNYHMEKWSIVWRSKLFLCCRLHTHTATHFPSLGIMVVLQLSLLELVSPYHSPVCLSFSFWVGKLALRLFFFCFFFQWPKRKNKNDFVHFFCEKHWKKLRKNASSVLYVTHFVLCILPSPFFLLLPHQLIYDTTSEMICQKTRHVTGVLNAHWCPFMLPS